MARGGVAGIGLRGGPAGVDGNTDAGATFALNQLASLGVGIADGSADTKLHVREADSTTTASSDVATFEHDNLTYGTPAPGIGVGVVLKVEGLGGGVPAARLRGVLSAVINSFENGSLRIGVISAGSFPTAGNEQFQVDPAIVTTIGKDAGTNTTAVVARHRHRSSGTAAAGYGTGVALAGQNAAGTDVDAAVIRAVLTTLTAGAHAGALRFAVPVAGALPAEGSEQLLIGPTDVESKVGLKLPLVTKTANYTLTANDHTVLADATSGANTQTLPDATTCARRIYNIKRISTNGNNVTVASNGGNIDNASAVVLIAMQAIAVQSDGTNWWVLP